MIPIIIFQVRYPTERMSARIIRGPEAKVRRADIIITLTTNITPSSEVESRTLRQALCLFLKTNEPLDNLKIATEVGPPGIWKLDQCIPLNATISSPAPMPTSTLELSISLFSNLQSPVEFSSDNIINHDKICQYGNSKFWPVHSSLHHYYEFRACADVSSHHLNWALSEFPILSQILARYYRQLWPNVPVQTKKPHLENTDAKRKKINKLLQTDNYS